MLNLKGFLDSDTKTAMNLLESRKEIQAQLVSA